MDVSTTLLTRGSKECAGDVDGGFGLSTYFTLVELDNRLEMFVHVGVVWLWR